MMTRQQAIDFLLNSPHKFGHMVGFTKLTKLHSKWIRELVRIPKDKTIQAHRGSYKTTSVSLALAIILILLPNKRVAFIRKTDSDVKEIILQVQKILRTPQARYFAKVIHGVDLRLTVASQTQVSTNLNTDIRGTAQLTGFGIGASVTGRHFDILFTDDIVNISDRVSRAERERTKLFYQELQNIKNPDGWINNTGTPWHKDDAFELMPEPEVYDCYSTGLLTQEEIEQKRNSMTPSLFCANYEMKHIADDDVLFFNPQLGADPSSVLNGVSHLDSAYYGEDYTAFTIMAIHDGKFYVYGRCWRRHIDDCMDEIVSLYQRFLCGKLLTETNADKGYSAKELKRRGCRVLPYHENMNKHLKISTYLKGEWENVIFCEGTDDEYIDQVCDYNENAEHDDCPDSLASLIRKYERKKGRDSSQPAILNYQSVTGL